MLKTAQDAYLAGRQAAMEKLAVSDQTLIGSAPAAGMLLGTGIGTYRGGGDSDALIRAARGSLIGTPLGSIGGLALGVPLSALIYPEEDDTQDTMRRRKEKRDNIILGALAAGTSLGGLLGGAINPGAKK